MRSDGTPSKAIPPLLNVHVYFAKTCRCRVAIPQASKLAKTVASDGTPSKQPSSFRHVTSLDGRTYTKPCLHSNFCTGVYIRVFNIYLYVYIFISIYCCKTTTKTLIHVHAKVLHLSLYLCIYIYMIVFAWFYFKNHLH